MIPVTCFKDKKVALFGLGGSGFATAHALAEGGADVVAWDDAKARRDQAKKDGIVCADLKKAEWTGFDALVLAPGVPLTHPEPHWTVKKAQKHGVEIIGDIELFCRERRFLGIDAPLIAITGTNGKSTTTALISHLLKTLGFDAQMGGNIGTPILALESIEASRYYVIECSSYQIDLAPGLDPTIGIHLNLSPDHLDRHGSMEHYAAIKERLVAGAKIAVVGVDDEMSAAIAERQQLASKPVCPVSGTRALTNGTYVVDGKLFDAVEGAASEVCDLTGIDSLRGAHNGQNAAAAYAVMRALGCGADQVAEAFRSFPGLHHRMELVVRKGNVLFVNDSKATNADAAARALGSFDRIYWIAGGKPKAGGITSLDGFFPRIVEAFLIGEAEDDFAETLKGKVPVNHCGTLSKAVEAAAAAAKADTAAEVAVLLSPACASFDQFSSFEERGTAFADLVRGLDAVSPKEEVA